ncbi:mannose-1-phosphate guanyltransferase alpha [Capsicum annuum]|uniref:mannose-1-phosphate guanyltransferase alpha n=1 Tax=Capsicum annuum TaxID=4072 RepID=UPI0007BF4830|nr:mannose-1-phosphate guanyltransferase alpha [Capsicum annuum]
MLANLRRVSIFEAFQPTNSNELPKKVRFTWKLETIEKTASFAKKLRGRSGIEIQATPMVVPHQIHPNVSISANARIGVGARLISCIILDNVEIQENTIVIHAIVGWKSSIGRWSRVQISDGGSYILV